MAITAIFLSSSAAAAAPASGAAVKAEVSKTKKKAKKKAKKRKIQVSIVGVNQNQLSRDRVLKVKVRSARKGKIKVSAKSTTFDRRGKYYALTKVARPHFKRGGQLKVVKLRLTSGGVTAVKSCEDRDIQAQAGAVKSKFRSLVRQSALCAPRQLDLSRAERCDFIVDQQEPLCMVPFPNNFYSRADTTTETGRRIHFRTDAMPKNQAGIPIDATPYNQSDGFSQGQGIILRVPGLDNPEALAQTNPAGLADPSRYLDANAPVIVLNTKTGQRHPIWVEIDSNATSSQTTTLMIHPLVNFDSAGRYIVVLRHLKDSAGNTLEAPAGFRYYRDILPSREIVINQRRSYFEDIFRRLRNAGIQRRNLYLTWDFTVASDENNTSRALSMRDQAFAELGDTKLDDRTIPDDSTAPVFTVDSTEENPNPQVVRRIKGHFEVPCYLKNPGGADDCGPNATMNLGPDGMPVKTGTWNANFECIVPHAVVDSPGAEPGRAMVYGHGLMGNIAGEIEADPQRDLADDHGFVICGTDEIGMSTPDIGPVANALIDLSGFPKVADRLQQGLLNEMYLTRLMIHPDGLVSAPEFRVDPLDMSSDPVIDTNSARAYYRGNSQGGIMGGALTALSPDFDRAALGVSAMNYSVLLTRSAAWETYGGIFNPSYTDEEARPLALGIAQMLWDRGEPNGYAHRMTGDPLPNTPGHKVLMDIAFGDHLVTNWQSNVMARTIGARAVNPFISSGRWPGVDFQWGIEPITGYPYDGSAIAYWDSGPVRPDPDNPGQFIGNTVPPIQNVAPILGEDPHEDPRRADTAQQMVSDFLAPNGRVTNTCAPGACHAGGFTGP
ncbi:MAG TPA: hypothetical protein VMF31_01360 [Solirubrobacterales bacterium]|nr:hypothetical protein [Solirubrobacterales bacterium]